jgi:hypothetical protein
MAKTENCPTCKGKGRCWVCEGSGHKGKWITSKCDACGGGKACPRCKGSGKA